MKAFPSPTKAGARLAPPLLGIAAVLAYAAALLAFGVMACALAGLAGGAGGAR